MFVLVLQELPDLLRPPEGSGACMDFADGLRVVAEVTRPPIYVGYRPNGQ